VPSALKNCTEMMLEPASKIKALILSVLSMGKKESEALASSPHDCAFCCACKAFEPSGLLMLLALSSL
jgi:hypothetical protein